MKCPAFFKFFIEELNEKDLKIPKAFTNQIEEVLPKKVCITDRYDNSWSMKVEKLEGDWYFMDGWVKFAQDNLLESGDLLVFEYFARGYFNVKIYGPSAVEKKGGGVSSSIGIENVHDTLDERNVDNNKDNDDDNDDDDEEEEAEEEFEEEEIEAENDYMFVRRGEEIEQNENDYEEETEENYSESGHQNKQRDVAGSNRRRGRPSADMLAQRYGADIFKAGLAEQPQNPYFVTMIMEKRKGNLFIPKEVVADNNLDFSRETHFIDPQGRSFRAKCKIWKDGRVVVSGGWRKLCNMNFVGKDDRCICEFVEDETGGQFIHVSFVRANELQD